jgi:hypothetical protein
MLSPLLADWSFWLSFAIPLVISIFFTVLVARYWVKKVPGTTTVTLSSDALRSSIDSGITVGSLVLPLAISLTVYLAIGLQQSPHDLFALLASIAIICLAVCVGIYNRYAIATVTNAAGAVIISSTSSTYVPAQFVFQLLLLLLGLMLLLWFCFFSLNPKQASTPLTQSAYSIPILRDSVRIGQSLDEVVAAWGRPGTRKDTSAETTLLYDTPTSVFTISLRSGKVTAVSERQKGSP